MADRLDQSPSPPQDLSGSQITIPSDSEPYSSLSPPSSSPPQSSNTNGDRPVIIYQSPTVWSIMRGAAINLLLPFVNGMMLGFGELLAHEFAFRLGWSATNVRVTCASGSSYVLEETGELTCASGMAYTPVVKANRTRCRNA